MSVGVSDRVLVVEDDSSWQQVLAEILTDLNLTVDILGDLESARDLFQIAGRYIVSPIKSGIMLVDPNAALERIWYEHFMDKYFHYDKIDAIKERVEWNSKLIYLILGGVILSIVIPIIKSIWLGQ